jgi:hypothetical protein
MVTVIVMVMLMQLGFVMYSDHSGTRTLAVEELLHTVAALKRGLVGVDERRIMV